MFAGGVCHFHGGCPIYSLNGIGILYRLGGFPSVSVCVVYCTDCLEP